MNDELFEIDDDGVGSILLNAFALTHGDRNNQYGPFVEDYQRVANVWNALCDGEPTVMCPEYALLFMTTMKLCRVAYGLHSGMAFENPAAVEDSITDATGYLDGLWKSLNTPDPVHEPDDIDDWDDDDDDCD